MGYVYIPREAQIDQGYTFRPTVSQRPFCCAPGGIVGMLRGACEASDAGRR